MTTTRRHAAVLTSLAAAAAMWVSGAAAGTTVPPDDTAGAAGSTPDDDLTIGFVTHVVGNPFIQQIIDAAEFAAEDLGVAIEVTGPAGGDADAQLTAAQNVVSAGADGLAVSVPGESMANGLNEIIESGVPVVQFNLLSTSVDAPYVGERSVESGRILGGQVLEMLGGAEATGQVILGNCFPGFPVLENRAVGVQEALAEAPGLEILGPFDVTVEAASNYAAWESLLAANPEAVALIGLCAPDLASLGPLQEANPDIDFIAGGYDLTEDNLAAIQDGFADVAIGQTPFMQGYLPVYMLVDALRNGTELELSFVDAGTEIVTADRVIEPFGLPEITFDELLELAASPDAAREYYQPLVDGVIADWQEHVEPIEAESE
ncbi:MAG: ribose transport system substrate-binding protein [Desertimonas sp.]|nr:ribose transport system substrate-binding protein [Desertimonas sp.]